MADGLGLLDDRFVILGVLAVELAVRPVSPFVQEKLGQSEVFFLSGLAVELDQPDFDFLMPRGAAALSRAEDAVDQVGALDGYVEEVPFSRGLEMGRGRFIEMPEVVELVAHVEVRPALLPHPVDRRVRRVDRPGCVEIAIVFLGGGDLGDDIIHLFFQPGIGIDHQRIGCAFDDLVDIGVVERIFRAERALGKAAGDLEILDPAGRFRLLEGEGDGDRTIGLDAWRPKIVAEFDGRQRNWADGIIRPRRFLAGDLRPHQERAGKKCPNPGFF